MTPGPQDIATVAMFVDTTGNFEWLNKGHGEVMDDLILSHLFSLVPMRWKRCGRKPIRRAVVIQLAVQPVRMGCDCWMYGESRTAVNLRVYSNGTVRHTLCGKVVANIDVSLFLPLKERPAKWVDPFELQ